MSKAKDRVRGNFMTSTCGDKKRLCLCEGVQVVKRGDKNVITLHIAGIDDDLYLEVTPFLATDIIDFLQIGLNGLQRKK